MTAFRRLLFSFLLLALFHFQAFSQSDRMSREAIAGIFETIAQNNAYADNLASAARNILPVGIERVQNNMRVTVAVHQVAFHAHYTELSVFARAILPQNSDGRETTLFFGARDIKLSHDGSIIGDANLVLLNDITIPLSSSMSLVLLGDYDRQTGQTQSLTYMSIYCFGFRELSLNAKLTFPETLLQRADNNGMVYGYIRTIIQDWNDIIAGVTLPPFQIAGLDGFVFNLQNVLFDFSDSRNADGFTFPPGYRNLIPGAETLWRGVFAQRLDITLPRAFDDVDGRPVSFSANNMLIDERGVTGLFTAHNILSFERGDASGWNFSVNDFILRLEANRLVEAGFSGQIGLPFYGGNSRLYYEARILQNNEYVMRVQPAESLDFSLFNATATIYENSFVRLHVANDRFRPEAVLHGHMRVAADGEIPVDIPRLDFRYLHLKTQAPYISIGSLGYYGQVTLGSSAGFRLSLSEIEMRSVGSGRIELGSAIEVALAQDLFSGSTRIAFLASLQDSGGRRQWRYDGVRMDDIELGVSIAEVIALRGRVGWHSDCPIYGEGFRGELGATIRPLGGLQVDMRGHFGAVRDFRYWFVDGHVGLQRGIPVMGPLTINGFAGAVTQRMVARGMQGGAVRYVPDETMGLGLKASVLLGIGDVGHGQASFDISFNNHGGLRFIGFYGFAEFAGVRQPALIESIVESYNDILSRVAGFEQGLQGLNDLKESNPIEAARIAMPIPSGKMGILGSIAIQYDFTNSTFHAKTELFINTPGNFLAGSGPRGRAGWGELYISPNDWFLHLGTPDDRLGIVLSLGNILNIRAGAYLMAGSGIPAMPLPPREVADILGAELSSLAMGRNVSALSTGRGFAFGADFRVATGDITFLILYANFMAGLGFDIMFKDFGDLVCEQTGRQMGMNGWYAMGQAYAFLQGELGVMVNLWFLRTRIPIIRGGAAALMQMGLPNPAFFRGDLGVRFEVLNGLVRGNMRFRITLGDECRPMIPGGSPLQMRMISDIAPTSGTNDISVFSTPQVTFNTAVGQQFEAMGEDGILHRYRIQLRSFTLRTDAGQEIVGTRHWNQDRTAVSFQSHEILPPDTRITARAEVTFEKFRGGGWHTVVTAGRDAMEYKVATFTTGDAPNYIPLSNIVYAYPVIGQRYFLTNESRTGFVQLRMGQQYLLERGFNYRLVFTGDSGQSISTNFTYSQHNNRFDFTIPELRNRGRYTLQLVFTPDEESTAAVGAGAQAREVVADEGDGSVIVEARGAEAALNLDIETSILEFDFATSRHATFRDKIAAITPDRPASQHAGYASRFLYTVRAEEAFDEAEIVGVLHSGWRPLVRPHAEMREPFFTQTIYPRVYSGYPFGGLRFTHRDDRVMGVPPHRSVFIYRRYLDLIADGRRAPQTFRFPFTFETAIEVERDFRNLQHVITNNRDRVSPAILSRFINSNLPAISYGRYRVILEYVLPDGTVTSSTPFYFHIFLRTIE